MPGYSATTMCFGTSAPLDGDTDDCSEKNKKWLVDVVNLIRAREGRGGRSPVFLLPGWWSHCAGARLPLGDDGLARPVIVEIKTVKKENKIIRDVPLHSMTYC